MAILQGYFCKQILTLKTETKIYILTAPRLAIKASKKHTTIKQVSLFTSEKNANTTAFHICISQ